MLAVNLRMVIRLLFIYLLFFFKKAANYRLAGVIRYVRPKEINMTDKKRKKNPNSYQTLPYSNVPFAILLFGD